MSHDQHVSTLFDKINVNSIGSELIDILCYILIIVGIIGNVFGLILFSSSRRCWKISSTYVYLSSSCSIINMFCVLRYACVLHSKCHNLLHDLVGEKWWACKLYEFSFSFRVLSSWLTLLWMFERLMCISTKFKSFLHRSNSCQLQFIIPTFTFIVLFILIIGLPVYMFQPQITNNDIVGSKLNINTMYCEIDGKASDQWKKYFHEIHFGFNHFTIRCLFSELIPGFITILFNIFIIYYLIQTNIYLHQLNQYKLMKKQARTTCWMNIVLTIHSLLFLFSLLCHIIGHIIVIEAHETWWVLLSILINSSLNFYIYCLSGKAFRNQIPRFIQHLRRNISKKCRFHRRRSTDYYDNLSFEMNDFQCIHQYGTNL